MLWKLVKTKIKFTQNFIKIFEQYLNWVRLQYLVYLEPATPTTLLELYSNSKVFIKAFRNWKLEFLK